MRHAGNRLVGVVIVGLYTLLGRLMVERHAGSLALAVLNFVAVS
jgi:hypothetical protein